MTTTMKMTAACALLAVAVPLTIIAQSAPARLGLSDAQAQDALLRSLEDGGLSVSSSTTRAFVALPPAARATLVDAAFTWTKTYATSAAFKTAYLHARDEEKPEAPAFAGSVDDELKRKQDEQAKSLEQSRSVLAMLPADQRAQMEATITQAEAQWKDPTMVALLRQGVVADRAQKQQAYQADLERWQQTRPADPLVLVARRLRDFLELSATVDFNAKLEGSGTDRRFVNEDYQSKPSDWKMCFRAGPDAVAAARRDAAAWLKELPQ